MKRDEDHGWILAWLLIMFMVFSVSMTGILANGYGIYAEGRSEADAIQARTTAVGLARSIGRNLEQGGGMRALIERRVEEGESFESNLSMEQGWPKELGDAHVRASYNQEAQELCLEVQVTKGVRQADVLLRMTRDHDGWEMLDYQIPGLSGEMELRDYETDGNNRDK